jgi:hypothetical protein
VVLVGFDNNGEYWIARNSWVSVQATLTERPTFPAQPPAPPPQRLLLGSGSSMILKLPA